MRKESEVVGATRIVVSAAKSLNTEATESTKITENTQQGLSVYSVRSVVKRSYHAPHCCAATAGIFAVPMCGQLSGQVESHLERFIQLLKVRPRKRSHIIGQVRLADAHEVVTHDPPRMLQAFFWTDCDLGGQSFPATKNGSTNHGGEAGIQEDLAANNSKGSGLLWVPSWSEHAVELASSHIDPPPAGSLPG